MNIADRSLALVDLALRRRFAFIDLEPKLEQKWEEWLLKHGNVSPEIVEKIREKMIQLNESITEDANLGSQFRVGHSYVTPGERETITDVPEWFHHVVETEIAPLLDEYWFDALDKAKEQKEKLLEGF